MVAASEPAAAPNDAVKTVRDELQETIKLFLSADPSRVPALMIKILKHKIALALLSELAGEGAAEDAYKQMVLLMRVIKGGGDMPNATDDTDDLDLARQELARMGIDAERAHRIVDVFERAAAKDTDGGPTIPDNYEPPGD